MKKLFLGSVALVALSLGTSAAFAAEKRVPAYTPPPPPAPAYTWTGCYVGASAGTSTGRSDGFNTTAGSTLVATTGVTALPASPLSQSFNLSGFIGGGQLGCNWQWGAWVFGIEGDGSATNKSGQAFPAVTTVGLVGVNQADAFELQERWLVTARGRLGLTNFWWFGPNTFVYVTGGGAWTKVDSSVTVLGTTGPISAATFQSDRRSGWTVGGGLEYALGYGWSVKGEYLYVDFGNWNTINNCPSIGVGCGPGSIFQGLNVNLKDHIWRAGMNYKFW